MDKFDKELQHLFKLMSTMHHRGLIFHKHRIRASLFSLRFQALRIPVSERKEYQECISLLRNIIDGRSQAIHKAMFAHKMLL